jgi:hypothetical protein
MLFETMNCVARDNALFDEVRKYKGKNWGAHLKYIVSLRSRYLELQLYRCVYCQAPIDADANGFRELEHILPKSSAGNSTNAGSNDFKNRRSTNGYADFTFEPLNLCLSCKVCNTKKGTFDPLLDRTVALAAYPARGSFCWFHPHYERYSDHIKVSPDFIFTEVTSNGGTVIDICGLADPESLAQRFTSRAEAAVVRNSGASLKKLANALATDIVQQKYGLAQAVAKLVEKKKMEAATAMALLKLWCDYVESDCDVNLLAKATHATAVVTSSKNP